MATLHRADAAFFFSRFHTKIFSLNSAADAQNQQEAVTM
jgi:hypothetical protein